MRALKIVHCASSQTGQTMAEEVHLLMMCLDDSGCSSDDSDLMDS